MLAGAMAEPVHPCNFVEHARQVSDFSETEVEGQPVRLISGISVKSCTYIATGP